MIIAAWTFRTGRGNNRIHLFLKKDIIVLCTVCKGYFMNDFHIKFLNIYDGVKPVICFNLYLDFFLRKSQRWKF